MSIFHLNLVDGWVFEIPINAELPKDNEQDIKEFVIKVENEGLIIIGHVLESFIDVFRVTTINKPTPIFPQGVSNKDFVNGNYLEKPLEKEKVIEVLRDYINQKDQNDHYKLKSRLGAIILHGAYRLMTLDKNQIPIESWIVRTSKELKMMYNEAVDMFKIVYWAPSLWPDIHKSTESARMHNIYIYLYSDDFFEITTEGPRVNKDLENAQKNRENLLTCLRAFNNKYPNSKISCLPPEEKWEGIDYLPFPGPVHERKYI